MKIYWVTKEGGACISTQLGLSAALRQRGHEVTLFIPKNFSEKKIKKGHIEYLPITKYPIISLLIYGLVLLFYFPFYVKKNKVDLIFVDGSTIYSPFFITQKLFGIPIIWDIRSLPIKEGKTILADISLYLSKYLVDGYTTISKELSEILVKKYHLQDKKIGIWSSAVSRQIFLEFKNKGKNINKISSDLFILIYHGVYFPSRGIENLICSIAKLENSLKNNIKLLLVGIQQNKINDLRSLCDSLDLKKQVDIIPFVKIEKIPFYIQVSNVGIIPLPPNKVCFRVSVPLKSLEYLSLGKPIIATNIPFHQKIFQMAECGVIINSNEPKDIADAITYLYYNREKLRDMGQKGKEIIKKYYTWEHKAFEVECFLNSILENK